MSVRFQSVWGGDFIRKIQDVHIWCHDRTDTVLEIQLSAIGRALYIGRALSTLAVRGQSQNNSPNSYSETRKAFNVRTFSYQPALCHFCHR